MVGRWILAPVVKVRVLAPQLNGAEAPFRVHIGGRVHSANNDRNSVFKDFVRNVTTFVRVGYGYFAASDTSGPRAGSCPCPRFGGRGPESPGTGCLRPVLARHTGRRASQRRPMAARRRSCGTTSDPAPRPAGDPLLRESSLAAQRSALQREATRQLTVSPAHLSGRATEVAATRAAIAKQSAAAALRRHASTPEAVICRIFGEHCKEALAVARCESRLQPWARNGQYLGLFQMERASGSSATANRPSSRPARVPLLRRVRRDWSPWGCKPWW